MHYGGRILLLERSLGGGEDGVKWEKVQHCTDLFFKALD